MPPMSESVRCLALVESDGQYLAVDVDGNPVDLPEGVTPRHVAAMMELWSRGNSVPLLRLIPPESLPMVAPRTGDR
jgi:hypothetical protein